MGEDGLNLTTQPPHHHRRNPENQPQRSDTAKAARCADSQHGNQCASHHRHRVHRRRGLFTILALGDVIRPQLHLNCSYRSKAVSSTSGFNLTRRPHRKQPASDFDSETLRRKNRTLLLQPVLSEEFEEYVSQENHIQDTFQPTTDVLTQLVSGSEYYTYSRMHSHLSWIDLRNNWTGCKSVMHWSLLSEVQLQLSISD